MNGHITERHHGRNARMRTRPYLLRASDIGQAGHSGYTRLADHVDGAMLISARRSEPQSFLARSGVRALTRVAASRWYRLGSFSVELRGWWHLQRQRFQV